MSATCEFYGECSLNGVVPVEFTDWEQIDYLERSLPFDFEHEEFIFTNRKGKSFCVEGINVDTALRLYDLGAAPDWLDNFIECFIERDGGKWRSSYDSCWTCDLIRIADDLHVEIDDVRSAMHTANIRYRKEVA